MAETHSESFGNLVRSTPKSDGFGHMSEGVRVFGPVRSRHSEKLDTRMAPDG
jgi:hypothetical protein